MDTNKLLDELYELTQIEQERELREKEKEKYMEIVEYCRDNDVEIGFAIVY